MQLALHTLIIVVLTLLSQLGGLAWGMALFWQGWRRLAAFPCCYLALWFGAAQLAPVFGRVPLDCTATGPLQVHAPLYCALNRHYVDPDMKAVLEAAARQVADAYPGTITQVLDASFPFFDGVPLLPHLSHDDGGKADIALYYAEGDNYLPGRTRSPLGYFAFEAGPTNCPPRALTLRWDLGWLQPLWRAWAIEPARMRLLLSALLEDPRVGKVLLEPHLQDTLGVSHPNLRFQGCRAARHDDHIHVQL